MTGTKNHDKKIETIQRCATLLAVLALVMFTNDFRFEISLTKAWLHIAGNFIFVYGLFAVSQTSIVLRSLITVFLVMHMVSVQSYSSPLSVGSLMSVVHATHEESASFVNLNLHALIPAVAILATLILFPVRAKKSVAVITVTFGAIYLFIPTVIEDLLSNRSADSGSEGGAYSSAENLKFDASARTFLSKAAYRFQPIKSGFAIRDSLILAALKINTQSSWTNVQVASDAPDLLIIGIGESLRASNMSLFGYGRNTTPNLSDRTGDILYFGDTYSAGTNTWVSLPAMLTMYELQPDFSRSVINLAKDAGYQVIWISNQTQYGKWDMALEPIISQSGIVYFSAKEKHSIPHDEFIIPVFKRLLIETDQIPKRLFILHFYGSHQEFVDRYPIEFDVFKSNDALIDQYDNSILYTDALQSEIIDIAGANNGAYMFFADHGLGKPGSQVALRHDIRETPALDSLHVPLLLTEPRRQIDFGEGVISLFYFECIFSTWSGITASELREKDYCRQAKKGGAVTFVDASRKMRQLKVDEFVID